MPFAHPAAGARPSPHAAGPRTARGPLAPAGYGYPVARPRVPAGLATGAIVVAIVYAAFRLVLALLSIPATAVWADAADRGLSYADADFVAYDLFGILLFPLGITIFVVGSLWLHTSRKFAEAVNPAYHHRRGAVWAWIGWVVPVVSLWFPYLVVSDVRRATIRNRPRPGIGVWWACWLVPLVCDQVTNRLTGGVLGTDPLTPAVAAYPLFEGLGAVLTGIGCWLWVAMIRELTAAQREWEVTPVA
ncbi:uncharacterized protein DUF4328 [Myceligenerans xiligouense]|uniref:Uncharacterized protein DUF4328 n=2 Tax=Myceligenerans xiligouense TaxID=253184 RepID=A0A3N4YU42_9MICO|nr:uncharacterized protein DUF4328 [Myceligenerans xiligouense]